MGFTDAISGAVIGTGRACGKAVLIGEHTVVYGLPAVAIPLPQLSVVATARVTGAVAPPHTTPAWRTDSEGTVDVRFTCGSASSSAGPDSGGIVAVAATLRRWGFDRNMVEVRITGDLPPARGFGASAACATAAVRAVADAAGVTVDATTLFELVQSGEQQVHGRASGVDAATVIAAQPIRFQNGIARPLTMETDTVAVLADTGLSGITRQAVQKVEEAMRHNPGHAHKLLSVAEDILEGALTAIGTEDAAALGARMTDFHALLREFGVSTTELDRLVDAALEAGALGAKLTGGGLGGCMLALTQPNDATRVERALIAAGACRTWTIPMRGWCR